MKSLRSSILALASLLTVSASAFDDVANFGRYEWANREVKAQPNHGTRVVFMGNSITDLWAQNRPGFFTENDFIGRGISGQTTYQFLMRFREDVVSLDPAAVVINGGTNDVAENMYSYNADRTFGNLISMVEIAQANDIKVIITSVLPAAGFGWNTAITDAPDKIEALNSRLRAYADEHDIPYVDYYSQLVSGDDRALNPFYTGDGVHPNHAGYEVMESIVLPVIRSIVPFEDQGPARLFISGDALGSATVECSRTSASKFEGIAQLTGGKSFTIKDQNGVAYTIRNGELTKGSEAVAVAADGLYCLDFDFMLNKGEMATISAMHLYYSPYVKREAKLDYIGDGVWEGTWKCRMTKTDGVKDGRYRFLMTTSAGERIYGSPRTSGMGEPDGSAEYYNVKKVSPAGHFDNTWTLPADLDRTDVKVRLSLRGTFTHRINPDESGIATTSADETGSTLVSAYGNEIAALADEVEIYGVDGTLKCRLAAGEKTRLASGVYVAAANSTTQKFIVK